MAYRLSEYFSVLLLEAGGPAPSLTSIPAFRLASTFVPELNYVYKSVKQKRASKRVRL